MKEATEEAIIILAKLITNNSKPDDAMKLTQAALNLAHVLATLENMKR